MKRVNFTIVTIPDTIWFTCPYCGEEIGIRYEKLDLAINRTATCTACGETVELGDYEYEN